jgi:hypothetical protein
MRVVAWGRVIMSLVGALVLPGCPSSASGAELCRAAGVERLCGIAAAQCQVTLEAQEGFHVEHIYTDWSVSVDDEQRCRLEAWDTGSDRFGFDDHEAERVGFFVGTATEEGTLLAPTDEPEDPAAPEEPGEPGEVDA